MAYEYELRSLLNWVQQNPGLTVTKLEASIRAVPWPAGDPDDWKPPFDGTRLDHTIPNISCLTWKLRYLELKGDARQERGRWFACQAPVDLNND